MEPRCRRSLLIVKFIISLSAVTLFVEITLLVLNSSLDEHGKSPSSIHEYHHYLKHVITSLLFDGIVILIGGMAICSLDLALLYAHTVVLIIYFFFRLHCTIQGPNVISIAAWMLIVFQVIVLGFVGKIIHAVHDLQNLGCHGVEEIDVKVNNLPPLPPVRYQASPRSP